MSGSETGDGVDESAESSGAQATYSEPESGGQPGRQHPGGFDRSQPGTDLGDLLSDNETQRFIKGLLGTFAILTAGLFLMILLADAFVEPAFGPEQDTSLEQDQLNDIYLFSTIQTAIGLLPFLGMLVIAGFGLLVGTQFSKPDGEKFKVSAIGAFAGLALFVFVATLLGSSQLPDLTLELQPLGVVFGTSLDSTQLLINSLVFGAIGAVVSAGVTYVSVTFAE